MRPFLSVIIATFNVEATLDACLRSIATQTCRDIEVLISDGGSSDGTLEIAAAYPALVRHVRSSADTGLYDAWNRVLDHAHGEWILFLGADDALIAPTVVAEVRDVLARHDVTEGFAAFPCWVTGKAERMLFKSVGAAMRARLRGHMGIAHTATLHHRSLFATYGTFDATFRIAGDLEFVLRARHAPLFTHPAPVLTVMAGDGLSNAPRHVRTRHAEVMRARTMHGLPAATLRQRYVMAREVLRSWRERLGVRGS